MLCARHFFFYRWGEVCSLNQCINKIVRTETKWVDAFFKSTEEPLAMMWVFYNGLLFISNIRHERCSEICISLCPTMTWCQSINISRNLREQLSLGGEACFMCASLAWRIRWVIHLTQGGPSLPSATVCFSGSLAWGRTSEFFWSEEVIPFIRSEKHAVMCAAIKYPSRCARDNHFRFVLF